MIHISQYFSMLNHSILMHLSIFKLISVSTVFPYKSPNEHFQKIPSTNKTLSDILSQGHYFKKSKIILLLHTPTKRPISQSAKYWQKKAVVGPIIIFLILKMISTKTNLKMYNYWCIPIYNVLNLQ